MSSSSSSSSSSSLSNTTAMDVDSAEWDAAALQALEDTERAYEQRKKARTSEPPASSSSSSTSLMEAAMMEAADRAENEYNERKRAAEAAALEVVAAMEPAAVEFNIKDPVQLSRWFQRHQSMVESSGNESFGAASSPSEDVGGIAHEGDDDMLYTEGDVRDAFGRRLGSSGRVIWCTFPIDRLIVDIDKDVNARCRTQRYPPAAGVSPDVDCRLTLAGMPMSVRTKLSPLFVTGVVTYSYKDLRQASQSSDGLPVKSTTDRDRLPMSVDRLAHMLVLCELERLRNLKRISASRNASGEPDADVVAALNRITPNRLPIAQYRGVAERLLEETGIAVGADLSMADGERLFVAMLKAWAGPTGNIQKTWSMRRNAEVVRYLAWPSIRQLRAYYTPRAIESQLRWRTPYTMRLWLQTVLTTPIDACFMRAGVCLQPMRIAECFSDVDQVPVPPELTFRACVRVLVATGTPIDSDDLASVAVYHAMRRVVGRDGCICVSARDLCSNTQYAQKFLLKVEPSAGVMTLSDARFRNALVLARGRGAIHFIYSSAAAAPMNTETAQSGAVGPSSVAELCDKNHCLILDYHRRCFELFYDACRMIRQNASVPIVAAEAPAAPAAAAPFVIPERACDEQRAALQSYLATGDATIFMLLIDGPGGAGKSELLDMIVKCNPNVVRIGGALPNQVVAMLRQRLGLPTFWTAHSTIYHHAKCHSVPGYEPPKFSALDYDNCLFDKTEEFIFDEMSVGDLPLLGVLLYTMASCSNGRLRRVILCGDCKQLPSIQPGDLWTDLLSFGQPHFMTRRPPMRGVAVHRFVHNHRIKHDTSPDLLALLDFNRHARNGDSHEAAKLITVTPLDAPLPDGASVTLVPYDMRANEDAASIRNMVAAGVLELNRRRLPGESVRDFSSRIAVITFRRDAVYEFNRQIGDLLFRLGKGVLGAPGDTRNLGQLGDYMHGGYDPAALYVDHKVQSKSNIEEFALNNNEIFVLDAIEDVNRNDGGGGGGDAAHRVASTNAPIHHGCARWLRLLPFVGGVVQPTKALLVPYSGETRDCLVSANCTTNHAFQGGQQQTVLYAMLMPRDGRAVIGDWHHETQKSFYTACSRGQQRLIMVAVNVEYVEGVISRAGKPRSTGLLHYVELRERQLLFLSQQPPPQMLQMLLLH